MSIGPTVGPVQRGSIDGAFRELFKRVEDLERVRVGLGDYVFLDEQFPDPDTGEIIFDTIAATWRHLVVKARLQAVSAGGILLVGWNDNEGGIQYDTVGYQNAAGTGTDVASGNSDGVTPLGSLELPPTGSGGDTQGYASVLLEFPYRNLPGVSVADEDTFVPACFFQSFAPATSTTSAYVTGAGYDIGYGTPYTISKIKLSAPGGGGLAFADDDTDLASKSRASLYGIR